MISVPPQVAGHDVTSKAFAFRRCEPDGAERQVFGIPDGGTVVRIGRIYYSDGQAITHTLISLPGPLAMIIVTHG